MIGWDDLIGLSSLNDSMILWQINVHSYGEIWSTTLDILFQSLISQRNILLWNTWIEPCGPNFWSQLNLPVFQAGLFWWHSGCCFPIAISCVHYCPDENLELQTLILLWSGMKILKMPECLPEGLRREIWVCPECCCGTLFEKVIMGRKAACWVALNNNAKRKSWSKRKAYCTCLLYHLPEQLVYRKMHVSGAPCTCISLQKTYLGH